MCGVFAYLGEKGAHQTPVSRGLQEMSSMLDRLPPYFNIDADASEAALPPPVGTADFAQIAAACAQGRADLIGRGLDESGAKSLRFFSTWEITKYLIPVATPISAGCSSRTLICRKAGQRPKVVPSGLRWTRCCACALSLDPRDQRPRNTSPTGPKGCLRKSALWRISKAGWARPRPRHIWQCQRLLMATRCWSSTSTVRGR